MVSIIEDEYNRSNPIPFDSISQPKEPVPTPPTPITVAVQPAGLAGSAAAARRLNVKDYSSSITSYQ